MGRLRGLVVFWVLLVAALVALVLWQPWRESSPANTLRLAFGADPKTLDPALATDAVSVTVCRRIHRTLIRYNPKLELVGDLAEAWEADGKRAYVFHLRRDAVFHNGRPVTARDVVYSLERLMDPRQSKFLWVVRQIRGAEAVNAGKAERAEGLKAPDEHTVRIEIEKPFAPFLAQLAMINAAVVPREAVEALGEDYGHRPVGAGPFKLRRWRANERVVLERFDGYRPAPARLQRVEWRIIKEPKLRVTNYEQGRLDIAAVPESQLASVEKGPHAAEIRRWTFMNTYYLGFALDKPPFKDNVHLRRAVNYAVDREYLCDKVCAGLAKPAKGVLPPGIRGYDPELAGYTYDPERAKEELAKAGYPGGKGLDAIPFFYPLPNPQRKRAAERIALDLKAIGIRTELQGLEWSPAYLDRTEKDPPPMFLIGWVADYPDPDNFLYVLFHSDQIPTPNRMRYRDETFDGLVEAARAAVDMEERVPIYRLAERRILKDAPWCFLYHNGGCLLVSPRVKGLELSPLDAGNDIIAADFAKLRLEEPSGEGELPPADAP